jgi:hypothetical protein
MDRKDGKKLFHIHVSMEHRDVSELRCAVYQPGYWSMIFTNDHQKVIEMAKETYKTMIDTYESDSFNKINPQLIISLMHYNEIIIEKRDEYDNKEYVMITGIRSLFKKIDPDLGKLSPTIMIFDDDQHDMCDIYFDNEVDFDSINQMMPCHKNDLIHLPLMYACTNKLQESHNMYALPP